MENWNDTIIWSEEVDDIFKKRGIALFDMCIANWAFTKPDALNIIDKLKEMQIPILGGDVLIGNSYAMQYNFDSWYCHKKDVPREDTYLNFSIEKAKQYIKNYNIKTNNNEDIFFTIVPLVKNNNLEIIRLVRW